MKKILIYISLFTLFLISCNNSEEITQITSEKIITNKDVKISDRLFLGGRGFRGFEVAGVGPRGISNNNALGGNFLYKVTTELAFPFGLPKELGIKARVFSVAGSLQDIDEDNVVNLGDTGSLRASLGIGMSWDSPFGPVQLDYARPIRSEDFDEKEFFSFGVGTFF